MTILNEVAVKQDWQIAIVSPPWVDTAAIAQAIAECLSVVWRVVTYPNSLKFMFDEEENANVEKLGGEQHLIAIHPLSAMLLPNALLKVYIDLDLEIAAVRECRGSGGKDFEGVWSQFRKAKAEYTTSLRKQYNVQQLNDQAQFDVVINLGETDIETASDSVLDMFYQKAYPPACVS